MFSLDLPDLCVSMGPLERWDKISMVGKLNNVILSLGMESNINKLTIFILLICKQSFPHVLWWSP